MLRKFQMMLLMILMIFSVSIEAKSKPSCDDVLTKCTVAVEKLQDTIEEQDDVVVAQDNLIKHQQDRIQTLEKESDTRTFFEVLGFALLLLL